MDYTNHASNPQNRVVSNCKQLAISALFRNRHSLWKVVLQIVVYDSQIFDFLEELVNFLEGKMTEIDSVGSILEFVVYCFRTILLVCCENRALMFCFLCLAGKTQYGFCAEMVGNIYE